MKGRKREMLRQIFRLDNQQPSDENKNNGVDSYSGLSAIGQGKKEKKATI